MPTTARASILILVAEDDPDDRDLLRDAMVQAGVPNPLTFVSDGTEVMEYLEGATGAKNGHASLPMPGLILLDLNMPRMDGRETLRLIRSNPRLRRTPVVVWTTSQSVDDVDMLYDLGANSFVTKPTTFDGLIRAVTRLSEYWLNTAQLPSEDPDPS